MLMMAATTPAAVVAQEAEAIDSGDLKGYGHALETAFPNYSGEEIPTADGRIIQYRQSDPYDEYEAAEGANATFIDMKSGKTQLVVPKNGDLMVFYLNVIYDEPDGDMGVGYVARVGTKDDYSNGKTDIVVGRFSDLAQKTLFRDVRFVDSPTGVGGDSISMIVWPQDTKAQYKVVDLRSFDVIVSTNIDLPKPVEVVRKPCRCDESGYGERLETYSPREEKGAVE